ncbi:hypothetical protein [Paraburkholderia sp. BL10I2N1]|uniref:hypothetical protein n=1 Tax=Paraburkholderia sp. BL10I2N1 TaxID=1938796 RepID=UPI0014151440|nr:hypothetical protein [Paraburkholderia sp. BL10I2N1]
MIVAVAACCSEEHAYVALFAAAIGEHAADRARIDYQLINSPSGIVRSFMPCASSDE